MRCNEIRGWKSIRDYLGKRTIFTARLYLAKNDLIAYDNGTPYINIEGYRELIYGEKSKGTRCTLILKRFEDIKAFTGIKNNGVLKRVLANMGLWYRDLAVDDFNRESKKKYMRYIRNRRKNKLKEVLNVGYGNIKRG